MRHLYISINGDKHTNHLRISKRRGDGHGNGRHCTIHLRMVGRRHDGNDYSKSGRYLYRDRNGWRRLYAYRNGEHCDKHRFGSDHNNGRANLCGKW